MTTDSSDNIQNLPHPPPPPPSVIAAARSYLITTIRDLNLFSDNPFWSSTLTLKEQLLSTRLFIIFVTISLLIVVGYTTLTIRTHQVTHEQFSISDFERFQRLYPNTIDVPCSNVSIPYYKFLNLSPKFHEVCNSSFIRNKWISSLFLPNATSHNILDIRTYGFAQFRSLSLLCRLARQSIRDTRRIFKSENLINRHLFPRMQFNEIASVLSTNLQNNILTSEKRTVSVVSMIIAQNRIFSALRTNYYITSKPGSRQYFTYNTVYIDENKTNEIGCDCRLQGNKCTYPAGAFYNWTLPVLGEAANNTPSPLFEIPGLMAGCIPLNTIRQSTLECLYNQSCINAISLQPKISQPKSLNISLTKFPIKLTIGEIFNRSLFVELWQNESNFEKYFSACAPQSLSYSYHGRFHLSAMITIVLSAFGGLVIGWQLITPAIVKILSLIRWKKQQRQSVILSNQTPFESAIMKMAPKPIKKAVRAHVHQTIHNFNLFPSDNKDDKEAERIGIISTRLYILLIFLGLIILGFYTSLSKRNVTFTKDKPTISDFKDLFLKYNSTLNCPCTQFSMSYGRIISLSPRYHLICSSDYLKSDWLSYFGRVEIDVDIVFFLTTDFRQSGQSFFELLTVLCDTANETIYSALKVFKSTRLVTVNALTESQFNYTTRTRMKQFEEQTVYSFVDLIQLIRTSIETNQLADEMWTNVGPFAVQDNKTSKWSFKFRSRDFYTHSCACATSNNCTRPVGFFSQSARSRDPPAIPIPGLVLGCYSVDSLLLSNLECFYEQECLQMVINNYYFNVTDLVIPLRESVRKIQPLSNKNSRFYPNTTINKIFSQLFVEDWINSSNYTAYYQRCAPSKCTYTLQKRFDTAYMLTMMLGFYGGLSAILEIILPPIVQFIREKWSKRKQKTQTDHSNTVSMETAVNVPVPNSGKSHNYFSNIYHKFVSFNLFPSEESSEEKQIEKDEIIATRIYIFLFILCISVSLVYYGPLSEEVIPMKEDLPTIDKLHELHRKNISSLSCQCSRAAVRYSRFLSIKGEYDSICSSEYVSSSYIDSLFKMNNSISLQLTTHYRTLSSLCDLSQRFIDNAGKVYGNRELVTVETLTHSSFEEQIETLIKTFISQTTVNYRRTLSFIISSFSVNQLLNLLQSNWEVNFTNEEEQYIIKTTPRKFASSNCSCATSYNCSETLIDNIRVGCFPYDGFRLSKFNNISLGKISDELFIKTWINKSNYTKYFEVCRPLDCQYTLPDKNNPLFMFTTILGIYGGLTYILHTVISQSLLAYRWWKENRRQKQMHIDATQPVAI